MSHGETSGIEESELQALTYNCAEVFVFKNAVLDTVMLAAACDPQSLREHGKYHGDCEKKSATGYGISEHTLTEDWVDWRMRRSR